MLRPSKYCGSPHQPLVQRREPGRALISFHDGDDDEDEEEEDNDDGNDDDDGVPPFPHHQDHEHPHNDDHDEEESHLSYQSELPHQDSQHVICISSSGCSRLVNYFI